MKKKYIDNVYDGKWKVIDCVECKGSHTRKYTLRNLFNGQEITVRDVTLRAIDRGERSVSKVISHKMFISGNNKFSFNKTWRKVRSING